MAYSKNPITNVINEFITKNYLNGFMAKFLPDYDFRITSGTRSPERNREVGGVADSAHLYGLAIDGNLTARDSAEVIDEMQGRIIFNDYFKPFWDGYAEFSPGTPSKRWHIHLNIDRSINNYTRWIGLAVVVGGGIFFVRQIKKKG